MIDLNGHEFNLNKDYPTPDKILKYISDYDIFRAYIENFSIGTAMRSPLRRDSHPSFSIFYSQSKNRLFFKDFKEGISGDVFTFLRLKFPGLSFHQILQDIVWTFNLEDKLFSDYKIAGHTKFNKPFASASVIESVMNQDVKRIRIKSREWQDYDMIYWASYGICKETLSLYNVIPVQYIFIENLSKNIENIIKADRYSYGYYENKDFISYKIYQPYSKELKFLGSHDQTVHSGYNQLPGVGDLLIITKSMKDVMAIVDNSYIPSVSVQSESILMKPKVMSEYKSRFTEVLTLFDNDPTGKKLSLAYEEEFEVRGLTIPKNNKYPITDYSDIIKYINRNTAIHILNKLIQNERI